MTLIIYYIAFVFVGDIAAYLAGLFIEYEWGEYPSLVAFLAIYFVVLWVAWKLAVRITTPRSLSSA
jgi:hypothetical protein